MITRLALSSILEKTSFFPAVGIIGPRQVGKTTLSLEVGSRADSIYLDLENPLDLTKLEDPLEYLTNLRGKLVILDEIQRKPELFPILRGIIDQNRRAGHKNGQFLILGSASVDLLRQSSESLAGRIVYEEMVPVLSKEYPQDLDRLWLSGGFPDSLLAKSTDQGLMWRKAFITTYLERDIPFFSPRIPSTTMRRLWTMLAHLQGSTLNASRIASSLGVSNQTVSRYIDLLVDLFLIRKLQPWYANTGKRITKSPKTYVRDSGILHALLNIENKDALLSHPVVGSSWEGFVIENIAGVIPKEAELFFYRTSGGAEIDLLIRYADGYTYAVEIKKSSVPQLERGFYEACEDIKPNEKYIIYQGTDSFHMKHDIFAIGLHDFLLKLNPDN